MPSVPRSTDPAERQRLALERVRARTERSRKAAGLAQKQARTKPAALPLHKRLAATIPETAIYLGCSVADVQDLIRTGTIRAFSLGPRLVRVSVASVLALRPPSEDDQPGRVMAGACGACPHTCAVCIKVQQRASKRATVQEACAILSCSFADLERLVHAGELSDLLGKDRRYHFAELAKIRQDRIRSATTKQAERVGIASQVAVLLTRRTEAHAILADWLRESSLLPPENDIVYGRRVLLAAPPAQGWYVYHLCYPNGEPFYIGKGKLRRMYQHADEARKGHKSHKCNVIRALWRAGQDIVYRVVFVTSSEAEAYAIERSEICRVGLMSLTNVHAGGLSHEEAGRLLGFTVPPEYLDAHRYIQWVYWQHAWRRLRLKDVRASLPSWARARTVHLQEMRSLALGVGDQRSIAIIDAEIERLSYLAARQLDIVYESLSHLERRSIRRGRLAYVAEWEDLDLRAHLERLRQEEQPVRRKRQSRIADQMRLNTDEPMS